MCITIPTFLLALWKLANAYKRRRERRMYQPEPPDGELFLLQESDSSTPPPSMPSSPSSSDERDIEMGWVQFNQVTACRKMMARLLVSLLTFCNQ
ncbi:uncharacterized protein BJX67DRAFT_379011 [Aspergillus lucknowensis]|uniref:Uncharacterized protein n=1 Tax=Aspergillus lucknowensis TaxID=176173 RepID=A0ABR4M1M3_9EURO